MSKTDVYSINQTSEFLRCSGVYKLLHKHEIVYVGQSVDIGKRIRTHVNEKIIDFDRFSIIECSEEEMMSIETVLINKYNPVYNRVDKYVSDSILAAKKRYETDDSMMPVVLCAYCNSPFIKKVSWAKFCCAPCRVAAHIEIREKNNLPVSARFKALARKPATNQNKEQ